LFPKVKNKPVLHFDKQSNHTLRGGGAGRG